MVDPTLHAFSGNVRISYCCMLLLHVSGQIVSFIAIAKTSQEAWDKLINLYANRASSRIMSLREWLMLTHHETKYITEFLKIIKSIANELALIDAPIYVDDLVIHILNGVGLEFKDMVAAIRAHENSISFEELHDKLVKNESTLKEISRSRLLFLQPTLHIGHLVSPTGIFTTALPTLRAPTTPHPDYRVTVVLVVTLALASTTVATKIHSDVLPFNLVKDIVIFVSFVINKDIMSSEVRYLDIEKLAFALKPETSGRLVKCAIELGEFDIHYKPCQATKGQAMGDFIFEFTEPRASIAPQILVEPTPTSDLVHISSNGNFDLSYPLWTLYIDGSSNAQGYGASLVLISPDKVALKYALRFKFHTSNNVTDYADAFARLVLALEQGIGRNIHMEFLDRPSTQTSTICAIDHSPTWMDPILQFLQNQTLLADPAKARRVRYRSARYLIIDGALIQARLQPPIPLVSDSRRR
ncbi:hypothetical protein L3X38_024115 [Prunus dulcis]|uniref:RNase H type-1 domain-containing protein n=1 Tax=Prunus dulcis TaxID=3755 RepID=A0AAD4Z551_PRUDU|nr:hypothetical protein L3X38_024115 [Prunus dulcis]